MSYLNKLEQRMAQDYYPLTELIHKSTKTNDFGYFGFMMTKGLWYKLRVYKWYKTEEGEVIIKDPDQYQYLSKAKAMKQLKYLS